MPSILRAFGSNDLALRIEQAMSPVKDGISPINWTPFYLFIFILCLTALIFINWSLLLKKWKKLQEKKIGDVCASDAVNYIMNGSYEGKSITGNQRPLWAWKALEHKFEKGELDFFAMPRGLAVHVKITKNCIKGLEFDPSFTKQNYVGVRDVYESLKDVKIIDPSNKKEIKYSNIAVSKIDMLKNWKSNSRVLYS